MKLSQSSAIKLLPNFVFILRETEFDFYAKSLLTEVKMKLLMSWMFCLGKHSNLFFCISLANKVSIVRTNIPKHPGHALTFPP
jgi:hypothetical protein